MKKPYLESVIEKYHLGGLVERVKIQVTDKTLTTKFISTQKNLVGVLEAPGITLPDCEFGVYDTSQLLKLIGITDHFLTLDVEATNNLLKHLGHEQTSTKPMTLANIYNIDETEFVTDNGHKKVGF